MFVAIVTKIFQHFGLFFRIAVYIVAEFRDGGLDHDAWFTPGGEWVMTEVDYARNLHDLPRAVQDGYAATRYAQDGWTVDDIDEIQRPAYETVYIIKVEKGGQPDHDLYFDLNGTPSARCRARAEAITAVW